MTLSSRLKEIAHGHGFDVVRIADAAPLVDAARTMHSRLASGHLDGMPWVTHERIDLATTPQRLLLGAKSFISLGISYLGVREPPPSVPGTPRGRIARYAWGSDYHDVLKDLTIQVRDDLIRACAQPVRARIFVDSSPLAERAVAERAGTGWFGKNTMILTPGVGSFTLLTTILVDVELEPDAPLGKSCGSCTRCISACPTGALVAPGVLDAPTCISFHTIENRGSIPLELRHLFGDWIFGCDDCQEICPVNRRAIEGRLASLRAYQDDDAFPALHQLLAMDNQQFRARYRGSAVTRTKHRGLIRNACVALGNVRDPSSVGPLLSLLHNPSTDPIIRGHAAWALGRIGGREARNGLESASKAVEEGSCLDEAGVGHASELEAALAMASTQRLR